MNDRSRGEPVATAVGGFIGVVGVIAATIWGLWCTWVALTGGVLPLPFMHLEVVEGSILLALLVLFVGVPILDTIAYWVGAVLAVLVGVPLGLAVRALRRRSG